MTVKRNALLFVRCGKVGKVCWFRQAACHDQEKKAINEGGSSLLAIIALLSENS